MDTDLACRDVGNHFGDKERAELRAISQMLAIVHHLLLESLYAADANAIDNANAVLVNCVQVNL